ncbi:MAG: hypothetical protein ACRDGN_05160 [bacterium]
MKTFYLIPTSWVESGGFCRNATEPGQANGWGWPGGPTIAMPYDVGRCPGDPSLSMLELDWHLGNERAHRIPFELQLSVIALGDVWEWATRPVPPALVAAFAPKGPEPGDPIGDVQLTDTMAAAARKLRVRGFLRP